MKQWKFDEAQIINAVVEGFSFSKVEIVIVFFMGISNHVEVATKHPRSFCRG